MAIVRRRLTVLPSRTPSPAARSMRRAGIDEDDVPRFRGRGAGRIVRVEGKRRHRAARASASGADSKIIAPLRGILPPRRGAVLRYDLRRRDHARLPEDQALHGGGDLVLFDPDVLRLAGDLPEARVLDQEPLGLGRAEGDARIPLRGKTGQLAYADAAARKQADVHRTRLGGRLWWSLHDAAKHSRLVRPSLRHGSQGNRCSALSRPSQGESPREERAPDRRYHVIE